MHERRTIASVGRWQGFLYAAAKRTLQSGSKRGSKSGSKSGSKITNRGANQGVSRNFFFLSRRHGRQASSHVEMVCSRLASQSFVLLDSCGFAFLGRLD